MFDAAGLQTDTTLIPTGAAQYLTAHHTLRRSCDRERTLDWHMTRNTRYAIPNLQLDIRRVRVIGIENTHQHLKDIKQTTVKNCTKDSHDRLTAPQTHIVTSHVRVSCAIGSRCQFWCHGYDTERLITNKAISPNCSEIAKPEFNQKRPELNPMQNNRWRLNYQRLGGSRPLKEHLRILSLKRTEIILEVLLNQNDCLLRNRSASSRNPIIPVTLDVVDRIDHLVCLSEKVTDKP